MGLWGAVGASWDCALSSSRLVSYGHVKLALLGELVCVLSMSKHQPLLPTFTWPHLLLRRRAAALGAALG